MYSYIRGYLVLFLWEALHTSDAGHSPVPVTAHPYMVHLEVNKTIKGDNFIQYCAGAIVTSDEILTAAQCLYTGDPQSPVKPSDIKIYFGTASGRIDYSAGVDSLYIHPSYDYGKQDYDIAILKSHGQMPVGPNNCQRIRLYTKNITEEIPVMLVGWGGVRSYTTGQIDSGTSLLSAVDLKAFPLSDGNCKMANPSYEAAPLTLLCTNSVPDVNKYCFDVGSILVTNDIKGGVALVGVYSSSQTAPPNTINDCGEKGLYHFYTNPIYDVLDGGPSNKQFMRSSTSTSWEELTTYSPLERERLKLE